MKVLLVISALVVCSAANSQVYKNFDGYQVLRTRASSQKGFAILGDLYENDNSLDFWTVPALGGNTDVMVPPGRLPAIRRLLEENEISYSVMLDNVGEIVRGQHEDLLRPRSGIMDWDNYQTLEAINSWLDSLPQQYPNLATVQIIGNSTQGRPIRLIKISTGGSGKPALFLDGTIHAREWISAATVTYIINELTVNSANYTDILNAVDFYVLPIINVDGYAFTFSNNRMWRKTRSVNGNSFGVDANRNFDYQWNSCSGCSSGTPSSETYRGPTPFSEPEAAAIRDFFLRNSDVNWQSYITVHSYGQYFMCPWGYTENLPVDYPELKLVSDYVAGNISALYGTRYTTGSSAITIYGTDGSSQDWAYGASRIKFTYTAELRDTGRYGFLLPVDQIIPTATETWTGFQVVVKHIAAATN